MCVHIDNIDTNYNTTKAEKIEPREFCKIQFSDSLKVGVNLLGNM